MNGSRDITTESWIEFQNNTEANPRNWYLQHEQDGDGSDESYLYVFDLLPVRFSLLALYSIVFVFCVLGNLAVVLVTTFHHKMRSTTKFFLTHLAIANLCVGIFCIYQHLSMYLIQSWNFGTFPCKMYHFAISLSQTASVLILIVTAVERYCAIVHPFRNRSLLTMKRRYAIIAAVWLTSSVLSFHKFYYVTLIKHRLSSTNVEIICAMDVTNFDHKLADLITFILLFIFPMTVISVLYLRIILFLRRQGKQSIFTRPEQIPLTPTSRLINHRNEDTIHHYSQYHELNRFSAIESTQGPTDGDRSSPFSINTELETQTNDHIVVQNGFPRADDGDDDNSVEGSISESSVTLRFERVEHRLSVTTQGSISNPSRLHRARKSAMKTLILVAVSFAVCNLPFYVQKMLQNYFSLYESDNPWLELISPLCFLLMCVNCAVNPFLHALHNRKFQRCLREILSCKCRRRFARV